MTPKVLELSRERASASKEGGAQIPLLKAPPGGGGPGEDERTFRHRGEHGELATIEIGFVNNMPSSAFDATEAQFASLLEAAANLLGDTTVRFSRYALGGLERTTEVRERIARDYIPASRVPGGGLDGLIVTGTEPLTDDLRSERYWDELSRLIKWAEDATASTVVSCLAAHAAALLFDGIERESLPVKCSGVFVQDVFPGHELTEGLGQKVHMPHSRLNDLPAALLQADGYTNLIESPEMNWTVAIKERGQCTFVLVQGHPEYSTTSLLREYRRDMLRYLRAERRTPPAIPVGYVGAEGHRLLEDFAARALAGPAGPGLMDEFPFEQVAAGLVNTWQGAGALLYANWLRLIQHRRQNRAR